VRLLQRCARGVCLRACVDISGWHIADGICCSLALMYPWQAYSWPATNLAGMLLSGLLHGWHAASSMKSVADHRARRQRQLPGLSAMYFSELPCSRSSIQQCAVDPQTMRCSAHLLTVLPPLPSLLQGREVQRGQLGQGPAVLRQLQADARHVVGAAAARPGGHRRRCVCCPPRWGPACVWSYQQLCKLTRCTWRCPSRVGACPLLLGTTQARDFSVLHNVTIPG
jgi:hypothetical protein